MRLREASAGEDDPRVTVIAVWTDAKVTFLLDDLTLRMYAEVAARSR